MPIASKSLDKHKTKNPFKLVPWYGWLSGLLMIGLFAGFYKLAEFIDINTVSHGYWWYCSKIDTIDNAIPFVPYFFIEMYVLAYLIWIISPIIISTGDKKHFINFMIATIIAQITCFIILVVCPSYQNRVEDGLFEKIEAIDKNKTPITRFLMETIVNNDGKELAWNMLPSTHSLCSSLCILGIFRRKEIHIGIRIPIEISNACVILSTIFVKQHYLADLIAGVGLACVTWFLTVPFNPASAILSKHPNFLVIQRKKKKVREK